MDFEITPDLQQLIDSVRSVLASECPTALVRDVVENGSAPEQPWKSACELGWTAIDLPEALDGLDLERWLVRVATNLSLDCLRRRRRVRQLGHRVHRDQVHVGVEAV